MPVKQHIKPLCVKAFFNDRDTRIIAARCRLIEDRADMICGQH